MLTLSTRNTRRAAKPSWYSRLWKFLTTVQEDQPVIACQMCGKDCGPHTHNYLRFKWHTVSKCCKYSIINTITGQVQ